MRRNELRLRETLGDLDRLRASVDGWLYARRAPQYRSQLTALGDVVTGTLAWVREQVAPLPTDGDPGELYEECRIADRRAIFVNRLWSWYRDKFDQRQDRGRLGETLAAADEVVWSCYAQGFDGAGASRGPVPLPYIEPLFSAFITPRWNRLGTCRPRATGSSGSISPSSPSPPSGCRRRASTARGC